MIQILHNIGTVWECVAVGEYCTRLITLQRAETLSYVRFNGRLFVGCVSRVSL